MKFSPARFGIILVSLFILSACAGPDHSDLRQVMERQVELIEECTDSVSRARDAADLVAGVDRFCASMDALSPRAQRLRTRYRDLLSQIRQGRIPRSLRPVMRRIQALEPRLFRAGAAMMRLAGDPMVEAARRKYEQALHTAVWDSADQRSQNP